MLLIAGGNRDPNLLWLLKQAACYGIPVQSLLIKKESSPAITWDIQSNQIMINDQPTNIRAAFVRRDVFHESGEEGIYRAGTWYSSLNGWLASNPEVLTFNRTYLTCLTNKLHALYLADKVGLRIPDTWMSNRLNAAGNGESKSIIAKPVNGGGYCQEVSELLGSTEIRKGNAACPAIIQQKIVGPDIRIYRIGKQFFGFKIESEVLDYRQAKARKIQFLNKLHSPIVKKMRKLLDEMGLDWGAVDFKYELKTKKYYFLEVNSNPMFSAFDKVSHGRLSASIFEALTGMKSLGLTKMYTRRAKVNI